MSNIFYITYATGDKYLEMADKIVNNSSKYFDKNILYKKEDIDDEFYNKNKKILDSKIGAGYWLWKPYFILKTLEKVNENDIVFYLDLGDDLYNDIKDFILEGVRGGDGFFLIEGHHNHLRWTKNDCFILMNCNEPEYFNSTQLEAGCCAFIKNDKTLNFIREWLFFCQDYDIVSNESKTPNDNSFIEHRWDQSILTNLSIKHKIKTVSIHEASRYIIYNKYF